MTPTAIQRTLESKLRNLAEISLPEDAEEPILGSAVRAAVRDWMTEIWAAGELDAVGLKPRRTAILFGPPGCGKTTLAHHFAARLGLPLVTIRMDQVMDRSLGASEKNAARIFDAVKGHENECVLFLDEFDTVAGTRANTSSDGGGAVRATNAVVTTLLTRIEAFDGLAIAATNRDTDIDPALWRRFGIHLDVALPDSAARFAILKRYLAPYDVDDMFFDILAGNTEGASPALLRQLMEGIKRLLVLNTEWTVESDIVEVFQHVIASLHPHPAYDKPLLWMNGGADLKGVNWPPT
jgi:SpoVK/Ycf46/Vps4 family AAA+-type ATPase